MAFRSIVFLSVYLYGFTCGQITPPIPVPDPDDPDIPDVPDIPVDPTDPVIDPDSLLPLIPADETPSNIDQDEIENALNCVVEAFPGEITLDN